MAKYKLRHEPVYNEEKVFEKSKKPDKTRKCKNYDCDDNDGGLCLRFESKASKLCKEFKK